MDGVLADSEGLICESAIKMFDELGLSVAPDDFRPFVGTGEIRYLGGVAENYGFDIDIASAKRRTYEIYLELAPTHLRSFPGARELVLECRSNGLKTAVASSADRIKIDANLSALDLPAEEWGTVVCGEEVTKKKPDPDIFLHAAAKLGVHPHACVVIEDAFHGIEAAISAEMRCIAVAHTFPAATLRDAHVVRETISEVTMQDLTGLEA
ncbi:MAG: HAD-IA family hydrolase [Verrucomicrobia bacterium]|nr:HAD-IA family hydrolase [Verrucomicrobiota bacterium]